MKHTILFNIASRTVLGLTPRQEEVVYNHIEDTMNGDGLYYGASKEIILEAYHHQHMVPWQSDTWVDLINQIIHPEIA